MSRIKKTKIFSEYNDIFADIGNVLMFGGSEVLKEDELSDVSKFLYYHTKINPIEQYMSIEKCWHGAHIRMLFVGAKGLPQIDADAPLRILGLDGALYREVLSKRAVKRCQNISESRSDSQAKCISPPLVTIVLHFGLEHWQAPRALSECLKVPEVLTPFINDYNLRVYEIAYLTDTQLKMLKSDFKYVADYFIQKRKTNFYLPPNGEISHPRELMQFMSVFTKENLFQKVYEKSLKISSPLPDMETLRQEFASVPQNRPQTEKENFSEGINKANVLTAKLLDDKRYNELERAVRDPVFQEALFREYELY